jgi:hypothetical protein
MIDLVSTRVQNSVANYAGKFIEERLRAISALTDNVFKRKSLFDAQDAARCAR